jgi:arabinose-5-phosphate isomerase
MRNNIEIANEVIEFQIKALKNLKVVINKSFNQAVWAIVNCKSKIIVSGVGKSGKIASKISATLSSIGCPSFSISPSDCSHGDLGSITKNDLLILISYSGNTDELKNLIKYAKINKINLIGIVSDKDSYLYKSANIKIFMPKVKESGLGIVPTSSTTAQLCLGDALAISAMNQKKFNKLDFKKFHPSGNLGKKLKTASEVMLVKNKIPFVNENEKMINALKILNKKKLGFLVIVNNKKFNTGVFTDGDLKRLMQKKKNINNLKIKHFMTKKPFTVEKNMLASDVLNLMNSKKITNIGVYSKESKRQIIGVIHIHNLIKLIK